MHAAECWFYYAVQTGSCHSYQTAGDRSRGECSGTDRAGSDTEDEISEGSDMDLCRNRYCTAGSSTCTGQNKLRCEAFPYGNSAV